MENTAPAGLARDKHGSTVDQDRHIVVSVHEGLLSRLLYSNPVCLLSSSSNIMTISWLTPIDNNGNFVASMNKMRHTASILREEFQRNQQANLVLNIPASDLSETILKVGGCHGDTVDKWESCHLTKCTLDWSPWVADGPEPVPSIAECVAHLKCVITKMEDGWCDGHWMLGGRIERASVKMSHWSGTQFAAQTPLDPPHLSFLGSQKFAAVTPFALDRQEPEKEKK